MYKKVTLSADSAAIYCTLIMRIINSKNWWCCNFCRLWGEIFHLAEYSGSSGNERSSWMRLSDGVVPINVTCSSSSSRDVGTSPTLPTTVFHIAAYSRHVEKILDVAISQPGACRSRCVCACVWSELTTATSNVCDNDGVTSEAPPDRILAKPWRCHHLG